MKLLPSLLRAQGIALTFKQVEAEQESFAPLGSAALRSGAKLLYIEGQMKDGTEIVGILVANQPGQQQAEFPKNSA